MWIWSRRGRWTAWTLVGALVAVFYLAPLSMIVLACFAGQWNGVLPSLPTLEHLQGALRATSLESVLVSLATAFAASLVALVLGAWAALALRRLTGATRRVLDLVFFLPSAVPSVSVGLGLLVAFSRPPVLLNGTVLIVIIAHLVLVSAFSYGSVAAGLDRLPPDVEQVAESLGARPAYRLLHVTLPLVLPHLVAAFGLSFALSMGELGATAMVYPPGWVTMPVNIFALSDRGEIFDGAALTVVLVACTLAVLLLAARVPLRAGQR
jgi:2-aminoethylphosphonate transport system permease protein